MRQPVVKFLGDADESNFCLKSIEFRNLPAFDLERETSLNGTFFTPLHETFRERISLLSFRNHRIIFSCEFIQKYSS